MKKRQYSFVVLFLCILVSLTACNRNGSEVNGTSETSVKQEFNDTANDAAEKALADAKLAKIAELKVYTEADYRTAEWTELSKIYNDAVAAIHALTDKAAVEAYDVASVNAQMAEIKTDAQWIKEENDAAEKALADAKQTKIAELKVYTEADYRTVEWTELSKIYNDAVAAIHALTDKAAVEAYDTASINVRMANIKTKAQWIKEENDAAAKALADAKRAKIAGLKVYVQADYRTAEWKELSKIYNDVVAAIHALTNKAAVEAYDVAAINAQMAKIKTKAQWIKEENDAAEKALAEAKQAKIAELKVYTQADYRTAEWAELSKIYNDAVAAIHALTDKAAVEAYDTASVNAQMAKIKTDAQLTEEEEAAIPAPTITTTLENGRTYKSDRFTIDVFAKNSKNEKIASTVTLNGVPVSINWDDSEKTSFTLIFTQKENVVVISATDGKKKTELVYTVYYEEDAITITLAVDAFTIGGGYLIAPTQIKISQALLSDMAEYFQMEDAQQMKNKLNGAYLLEYYLYKTGYTTDYTGKIGSGYYLATIFGFDYDGSGQSVPANLREIVESQGGTIEESDPEKDGLGEFCFTWMSGWMYTVNGIFANVGMSDYYPQDGDVWRVQFTLYGYGTDIGNGGWGSDPLFEQVGVERDALTLAMARAISQGKQSCAEYLAAYELIQQFGMTPNDLLQAAAVLNTVLKS